MNRGLTHNISKSLQQRSQQDSNGRCPLSPLLRALYATEFEMEQAFNQFELELSIDAADALTVLNDALCHTSDTYHPRTHAEGRSVNIQSNWPSFTIRLETNDPPFSPFKGRGFAFLHGELIEQGDRSHLSARSGISPILGWAPTGQKSLAIAILIASVSGVLVLLSLVITNLSWLAVFFIGVLVGVGLLVARDLRNLAEEQREEIEMFLSNALKAVVVRRAEADGV